MKKVLFLAVMLVASLSMQAQNAKGEFALKPMIGVNFANLTDTDADMKVGMSVGAEVEYGITDRVGLTGGLLFSMQGIKGEYDNYTDAKLKLNYINVPILANIYLLPGLALKAGIQPGFMVTSKLKAESGDIDASIDVKDACNTVDFTIPIGISYEISNLVLDARYNCGVSKAIEDADSRNSVFMLTVGYKFRL